MATSMGGFDDMNFLPPETFAVSSFAMDGDEYVRCSKCGYGGCDVRVSTCGCTLHARCLPLDPNGPLKNCSQCNKPTHGLVLFSLSFREIDEAHHTSLSLPSAKDNRGRKRRGSEIEGIPAATVPPCNFSDRRTGRWTNEEMALCDKLIAKFESGELPIAGGVKLNEFLGSMLKSKQSRLTKKMKNAKLSSKTFQITTGNLTPAEAREFSEIEEAFFQSILDLKERAEIKFHMQKEWREQFSRVCASLCQPLDADAYLTSCEEMDKRSSKARDAARMTKRKLMMGVALRTDTKNLEEGVFIERTEAEARTFAGIEDADMDDKEIEKEILSMLSGESPGIALDTAEQSSLLHSAPFLAKVTSFLQRHCVPFEHVDLWVPSFVPGDTDQEGTETACRLCYAGNSTTETVIGDNAKTPRQILPEEQFNLYSFGDYSQKFSFNVGSGLPGRVYESGHPTWEQFVHNAPANHFERCGGAAQCGIKTVLGIPVASPNVGRIVVVLYSCHDRPKDEDLVNRLSEEFTRLMPSPKWKLVVDIGEAKTSSPEDSFAASVNDAVGEQVSNSSKRDSMSDTSVAASSQVAAAPGRDERIDQVVSVLGKYMPSDPLSPLAPYVSGFMALRLLLLRTTRTAEEEQLVSTMLDSFSSYATGGREESDIAVMLARDFMFLNQQPQSQSFLEPGANVMNGHQFGEAAAPAGSNEPQGLSLFGLPSTSFSPENSPALTPIPAPGSIDALSIVSN